MQIVDEEQEDAAGRVVHAADGRQNDAFGRRRRRRFEHVGDAAAVAHRHRRDVLLDAVLVDFEVVLLQVGDESALLVLDDHVHRDGVDLDSEGGRPADSAPPAELARAPEPTGPRLSAAHSTVEPEPASLSP